MEEIRKVNNSFNSVEDSVVVTSGYAASPCDNTLSDGIVNRRFSTTSSDCGEPKSKESNRKTNMNNNSNMYSTSDSNTKPARKSSFVQQNLELHLSDSQRAKIEAILNSVKELTDTEKLVLYLKLPTREHDASTTTNSKQEQTFAFQWIRNNLEECDSSVNLPKHEVYDEYKAYCESESLTRFLSAPDFGKIVKCIYPNVKARRLGTRGNSKYCYNGLQRKISKEIIPKQKEQTTNQLAEEKNACEFSSCNVKIEDEDHTNDQILAAASALVCEWANKLLGRVFETLIELSKFLVAGSYVSTKSMASFIIMSASSDQISKINSRYSISNIASQSSTSMPARNKIQTIKSESTSLFDQLNNFSSNDVISSPSNTLVNGSPSCMKDESDFIPSIGAQVVPDIPSVNSYESKKGNTSQCSSLVNIDNKFTIDLSSPLVLSDSDSNGQLADDMKDVLMDNILVDNNKKNNISSIGTYSKSNHESGRTISEIKKAADSAHKSNPDAKRRKKHSNSPPTSLEHISMKDNKGFNQNQQSSFNNGYLMPTSSNIAMQRNFNQFLPWNNQYEDMIGRDQSLDNTATSHLDLVSNIERCHSAPMGGGKTKCMGRMEQPLTPQYGAFTFNSSKSKAYKAKRNLYDMFNNNNNSNDNNVHDLSNNPGNSLYSNKCSSLQNVPSIMPLDSKANIERVVPSEPLKDLSGFTNVDMSGHEDDFTDIASNVDHIDGHELLKTFQTSENWINDWSNMTMPVMNFT